MFVTQTWTNLDAAITDSTLIHTESNTSFSGFGRDGKISGVHLMVNCFIQQQEDCFTFLNVGSDEGIWDAR